MRSALVLLLTVLLGGCGYHLQGSRSALPPDVRTVFVEILDNRTLKPFLENEMTYAAIDRFMRSRVLTQVSRPGDADAVFSGTITDYRTYPISYDRFDTILEYRSVMTVSAALHRVQDGKTLWRGTLSWSEDYPAHPDKTTQDDHESSAIRVIAERLADEAYIRIVENF